MPKVKSVFYVPLEDNDGLNLTAQRKDLEMELYLRFVGWTFLGYVKGIYRMADGNPALDESAAYMVVLDEVRVGELEQVLRDFKLKTKQEAIYLEIQRDVEIRFVT